MKYELPLSIKNSLADKSVRLHHYLWHVLRNNWHQFTAQERQQVQSQNPKWVPLRPRMTAPGQLNIDAGEAFLFMHREMIKNVNDQLSHLKEPALQGWQNIPLINDADYPVPNAILQGIDSRNSKSPEILATLIQREQQVRDRLTLNQISLARLGAFIETYIHDVMHMRWSETEPALMSQFPRHNTTNTNPRIDSRFNDTGFDWLGFPYSSHVNSTFWKLHGWVDARIDDWMKANNVTQIQWVDPWIGDMPAGGHGGGHHHFRVMVNKDVRPFDESVHDHHFMQMFDLFKRICTFENFSAGFDYLNIQHIPSATIADFF